MKKLFFLIFIVGTSFSQISFAQDNSSSTQLLQTYFNMKNALVNDNANGASVDALKFIKLLNNNNAEMPGKNTRGALLKQATQISRAENIQQQRQYFASLSTNMHDLVKAVKPNKEAVYYSYCPMKKSYWLSESKDIKNPYFGNTMLTCGKVTEVLQ